ncbi:MAG: hypothetical protein EOM12_14965 [Verrucomicrobiae bacterium]|nr:hypothetical protein [Verrucomicrobiae bacterium]
MYTYDESIRANTELGYDGEVTKRPGTGGLVVQVMSVIVFFTGFLLYGIGIVITVPIAITLFVIGSKMNESYICSRCGNSVNRESKLCPHCQAVLAPCMTV